MHTSRDKNTEAMFNDDKYLYMHYISFSKTIDSTKKQLVTRIITTLNANTRNDDIDIHVVGQI